MKPAGNVLIVGATGFLGRALIDGLNAGGINPFCLVFQDRPRASAVPNSIESRSSSVSEIQGALEGIHFDCVYHVAAAGVLPSQRDPEKLLQGNLVLVSNLIRALASSPPRRLIYTGSCAEYSRASPPQGIREEHPTLPENLYGAAKAATTAWSLALAKSCGIPMTALRLFHFYGVGEAPNRLVPYLIDCLRHEVRVKLTKGEQSRDVLHVDDMVSALIKAGGAIDLPEPVYNVCSGKAVTVREIADTAARLLGKRTDLLDFGALPYRPEDEMWIVGDNYKFVRDTGWSPALTLEAGLERVTRISET